MISKTFETIAGEEKRYYALLDIVKYLCCVLVLVIHTYPLAFNYWLDGAVGIVTRFANPTFFAISSFLLFDRIIKNPDKEWSILWKQEKRILIMYSVWTLIYLAILFPIWIANKTNDNLNFVFFLRSIFLSGIIHYMWFFPALMFGLFITFLLFKVLKPITVLVIGACVLVIGVLFSTYSNLIVNIPVFSFIFEHFFSWFTAKNGLFFGFPYCAIGLLLAHLASNNKDIFLTQRTRNLIFFICSFIFLCFESLLVTKILNPAETYLWISVFPMILFFLFLILSFNIKSRPSFIIARKISVFIYCFEYIPISLFNLLFDYFGYQHWLRGITLFFVTFIVCNLIAFITYKLSLKKVFSFLKYLY